MESVAIDSRTPALERKELVEDFRRGKISVLVNVDIFSEGFDCPDVEFGRGFQAGKDQRVGQCGYFFRRF